MTTTRIKELFLEALELPISERESWLQANCANEQAIIESVKELLSSHDRTSLLDKNLEGGQRMQQIVQAARVLEFNTETTRSETENYRGRNRAGEVIGRYRLMELLGEGGFGQVYVGQQSEPVRRLVAIKLLKPGMDSREVVARFEAERQALAMMSHPNIAQVFDGGATGQGQPYLVMELVRGQPITEFCRTHQYSVRDKLLLIIDVCMAVQHAHQKGIIHRDLKPSNVLVALDETKPVAKVIDFGIAKAIGQSLTDKTIYTRFTQIIGTPMYMSPEQAEMKAQDVDTLTDVYALGVLLYELLTEQTPFDKNRIQSASFDEMRRIIREDQPLKPSAKVTALVGIESTKREQGDQQLKQRQLINQLRGDLDWVVLKAMDKDRRRRYETPAAMARDLKAFLEGQPVAARAPSTAYRLTRFAQRNLWAVIATSLVLLSLIGGTGVSIWQARNAIDARTEAEGLKQLALDSIEKLKAANILIDSARANIDQQRWEEALAQFTEATELQPDHFLGWAGRGNLHVRLGQWHEASSDYAKAIHLGAPANHPAWWGVPNLFLYAGDTQAYQVISRSLRAQLDKENTSDALQQLYAVRGICVAPILPEDGKQLSQILSKVDLDRLERQRGFRRGGPPGIPGAVRDWNRFDGRRPPPGGPPPGGPPSGGPPARAGGSIRGEGPPWANGSIREIISYVKALTCFRAGDSTKVLELLKDEKSRNRQGEPLLMEAPLLALANWEIGKKDEAHQQLNLGIERYRAWLADFDSESQRRPSSPWLDGLESWILLNEAHQKILGSPFPKQSELVTE
jgi:eukaryotic-like serine/threonine-protein kinase